LADERRFNTLKDIKVGEFVKFAGRDAQGKWHYIGEVVSVNDPVGYFKVMFIEGDWGFTSFTDDEFYAAVKPANWDKFKADPESYRDKLRGKAEKKRTEPAPVQKTIKEQVFDLVKENLKLSDAKLLKLLKTSINADPALLGNMMQLAKTKLSRPITP
jgi:hypothetical protein